MGLGRRVGVLFTRGELKGEGGVAFQCSEYYTHIIIKT